MALRKKSSPIQAGQLHRLNTQELRGWQSSVNLYDVCKPRASAGAGRAAGVPCPGALPVDVRAVAPKQGACRRHCSVAQDLHLSGENFFGSP